MAVDIAELGFSVDANGFVRASKAMDGMTAASKRANTATDKMVAKMQSLNRTLGLVALAAGAAGAAWAAASIKAAIAAEETAAKFQTVFRGSVKAANDALIELSKTVPLTVNQMRGLASGIQDMIVPMGIARKEAAGLSVQAVKLAGDIGSFNNVDTEEALNAIKSALAGSSEPMRRFGVDVTVTRLKALALAEGLIGVGEELDNAAKAQAVFRAITLDSSDAIGDLERTYDSTANQLRRMQRDIVQAKEDLGKGLIPAFGGFLEVINQVGDDGLTPLQSVLRGVSLFMLNLAKTTLQAIGGFKLMLEELMVLNDYMSVKMNAPEWLKMLGAAAGGNWGGVTSIIEGAADRQSGKAGTLAAQAQERAEKLKEELAKIEELIKAIEAAEAGIMTGLSSDLDDAGDSAEGLAKGLSAVEKAARDIGKIKNPFEQLKTDKLVADLKEEIKAREAGVEALRAYKKEQFGLAMVAKLGEEATEEEIAKVKELSDVLYDLRYPIEEVATAWENVGSVMSGFGGAMSEFLTTMANGVERGTKEYKKLEVAIAAANLVAALGAVLNQGNGDPYTAWARMAAMAAALGVAISGLQGGEPDTAAERQASQGTGSVLGDAAAKSESIVNATQITADAVSELVGINRGMLNALLVLQDAIAGATNSVARGALNSGAFGDIKDPKTPWYIPGGLPGTGLFDPIGILKGKAKLTDEGIAILSGSIADLINGDLVMAYREVSKKKWIFGKWKSKEELVELGGDAAAQIGLIFQAIADVVSQGALILGLSQDEIDAALAAFEVAERRISLMDLTAEEQQAELEAVFSEIFDGLAAAVVPFIGQFQEVGEGLGETLVRVATSVQVFHEALLMLGLAVDESDPEKFAQIAVGLIDLAGGLDAFIPKLKLFMDKFASDEWRRAFALDAITRGFAGLGIAIPESRDALWSFVQGLDLTTEAGRATLAAILDLTEELDTYYSLLDENADIQEDIAAARAEQLDDELQALLELQAIAEGIVGMLSSLRESILGDMLSPHDNYARFKGEADSLAAALQTMTDPEEIRATVERINNLTGQAWGLLDENQRAAMGQQFIDFLQMVEDTALRQLGYAANDLLNNTQLTPAEVLQRFHDEVSQPLILVAQLQEAAAVGLINAAAYLMGQEPADFGITPTAGASATPPATNSQETIQAAVEAGMQAAAQAIVDAAAVIASTGQSSDAATTASANQVAGAIRSLPQRIVVSLDRSEFN